MFYFLVIGHQAEARGSPDKSEKSYIWRKGYGSWRREVDGHYNVNTDSVYRYLSLSVIFNCFSKIVWVNTIYVFISFPSISNNWARLVDNPCKIVTPSSFKSIMDVNI